MQRLLSVWRDHSRTIVCLLAGTIITGAAWAVWPDGGNSWDVGSGVGTVLLAFGAEGIVNNWLRETARPEA